jgi:RNA polymerase sigma factor (sigma-70 family)
MASPKTLTREEELALIIQAKSGDLKARDAFIRANMRYADYYAIRMAERTSGDVDDLKAESYVGLLDALQRFDVTSGRRFMTYAMHWMKCHVLDWLRETRGMVHVPVRSTQPRVADRRLDAPLSDSDTTWLDLLEADGSPEIHLLEKEHVAHMVAQSRTLLAELDARERFIIEARIMRDAEDTLSFRELGESELNLSHEGVRQIEAKALRKMAAAVQRQKRSAA